HVLVNATARLVFAARMSIPVRVKARRVFVTESPLIEPRGAPRSVGAALASLVCYITKQSSMRSSLLGHNVEGCHNHVHVARRLRRGPQRWRGRGFRLVLH